MPRPPRVLVAGGIYHVTSRGNRRQPIFMGEEDADRFLCITSEVVRKHDWRWRAFCLLPNHFHLVVETRRPNLSVGMHCLKTRFVAWFNRRHGFEGHVFQNRFHAVLVESDWHLLELTRYLALNPVRAGLCETPDTWRWSSYRSLVGLTRPVAGVDLRPTLDQFGRTQAHARAAIRQFVSDAANGHGQVPGTETWPV